MKCPTCGNAQMTETVEDYRYDISGLPIVLQGIKVRRCSQCGEEAPTIRAMSELHRVIAQELTRKSTEGLSVVEQLVSYLGSMRVETARTELYRIATAIESLLTLTKSKIAIQLRSLDEPSQSTLPSWAEKQLQGIESSEFLFAPVIRRTEKLLCAVHAIVGASVLGVLDVSGPGRIGIQWNLGSRYLRWIVRPCEYPWPGVDVDVLEPDPEKPSALVSRRFYDATSLLEDLKCIVTEVSSEKIECRSLRTLAHNIEIGPVGVPAGWRQSLESLEDNWDEEGAPVPTKEAINEAERFVLWAQERQLHITDIGPDVLGGVGIYLEGTADNRQAWLSCGALTAVLEHGDEVAAHFPLDNDALERVASFLMGGHASPPR